MGEGLRDGEAPRCGLEIVAPERERELVSAAGLLAECGGRLLEPDTVVLLQLPGPSRRVLDHLAVPGQRDVRVERDRAVERLQVVAERVGPARGPEPYGGRDGIEDVVGRDEHAVLQK